jgi:NAD-dependent deacetylase
MIMDNELEKKVAELQEMINGSDNIVFFGGAGVSTESGIPDFRSQDGLYNQKYDYPPETILSHSFFMRNPSEFYRFYKEKTLLVGSDMNPEPNKAHKKLAELEEAGKLKAVITQNIDDLHHRAGSKTIYELHGTVTRSYCMDCDKEFDVDYIKNSEDVPKCDVCGGIVKPDVVLYEEGLDMYTMEQSINAIRNADMLIIGGTSLVVYPAAGLIDYYRGHKLVLINKGTTGREAGADLVINGPIGEVLGAIKV